MAFAGNSTALRIYFIKELLSLKKVYWHISFSLLPLVSGAYDFQGQMAKDEGLYLSPGPWASAVVTASTIFLPAAMGAPGGCDTAPSRGSNRNRMNTAHPSKQLPSSIEVQGAETVPV